MAKEFTWHCGASSLVDDNYIKFDIKATNVLEAQEKAFKYAMDSKVLDGGSVDMEMDITELARELGNLAADDSDDDWSPVYLTSELESVKGCKELMSTLEWIVSNANK